MQHKWYPFLHRDPSGTDSRHLLNALHLEYLPFLQPPGFLLGFFDPISCPYLFLWMGKAFDERCLSFLLLQLHMPDGSLMWHANHLQHSMLWAELWKQAEGGQNSLHMISMKLPTQCPLPMHQHDLVVA